MMDDLDFTVEIVDIDSLRDHPRNYKSHPEDQIEHIKESIKEHGIYQNIVAASDDVLLAGHGVRKAAKQLGYTRIPIKRLSIDSEHPKAIKVLIGDNEISHLAEIDDRELTEMLKELADWDIDELLGTGFDEMMVANLAYVTRTAEEIKDFNEAAHWLGLPEYESAGALANAITLVVRFRDMNDRQQFLDLVGLELTEQAKSTWWPPKEKEDYRSIKFEGNHE